MIVATPVLGDAVRIRGRVQDATGRPITSGEVTVRANNAVVVDRAPLPGGLLDIRFTTDERVVTLIVKSQGFETREATLDVQSNLELKPIRLQRSPGLRVGPIVHYRAPGQLNDTLDVTIQSEYPERDALITTLKLAATRRRKTECLDLVTPAVKFAIPGVVRAGKGEGAAVELVVTDGASGESATLSAQGAYEVLPCRQRRFIMEIHYVLSLKPGAQGKLRLVLPSVSEKAGDKPKALELEQWDDVALVVVEHGGRETKGSEWLKLRK